MEALCLRFVGQQFQELVTNPSRERAQFKKTQIEDQKRKREEIQRTASLAAQAEAEGKEGAEDSDMPFPQ